jgi:hypothetical protein
MIKTLAVDVSLGTCRIQIQVSRHKCSRACFSGSNESFLALLVRHGRLIVLYFSRLRIQGLRPTDVVCPSRGPWQGPTWPCSCRAC